MGIRDRLQKVIDDTGKSKNKRKMSEGDIWGYIIWFALTFAVIVGAFKSEIIAYLEQFT